MASVVEAVTGLADDPPVLHAYALPVLYASLSGHPKNALAVGGTVGES